MLHTIVIILKLIGIVLGVLISLVLLLLFLVAFVPVRYHIEGNSKNGHNWNIKLTWLKPFVLFLISYQEGKLTTILKIIGIRIDLDKEKKEKSSKRKKKSKKPKSKKPKSKKPKTKKSKNKDSDTKDFENKGFENKGFENKNIEDSEIENKESQNKETAEALKADTSHMITDIKDSDTKEKSYSVWERTGIEEKGYSKIQSNYISSSQDDDTKENNSKNQAQQPKRNRNIWMKVKEFFKRALQFFRSIINSIKNLKYTFLNLYGKIKTLRDRKNYYLEIINKEGSKSAVATILKQAVILVRHGRPRKPKIYIHFGTGNPETDGYLLGLGSVIYSLLGDGFRMIPDFEQTIFEYEVSLKGKTQVIVLLKIAWRLYFNKELKNLMSDLKYKEEK